MSKAPESPDPTSAQQPTLTRRQINDQRVEEIVSIMGSGMWIPGKCHQELARKWGISTSRVRELAAQASRLIMMSQENREEVSAALFAGIAAIQAKALSHSRPDFRSAIAALELAAKMNGMVINRTEAKIQEVDSLDDLPPEELASKLEAEAAALRKQSKSAKKKGEPKKSK